MFRRRTVTGSRACFIKSLFKSAKEGAGQKANKTHTGHFSGAHRELVTHHLNNLNNTRKNYIIKQFQFFVFGDFFVVV